MYLILKYIIYFRGIRKLKVKNIRTTSTMPEIHVLQASREHMVAQELACSYRAVMHLVDGLFKPGCKLAISSFIALMQLVHHS
jgi:hypothetical protein